MTQSESETLEEMRTDLRWIRKTLERMESDLDDIPREAAGLYVTKAEFEPVRRIVYLGVTILIVTVLGALLSQVVIPK